MNGYTRITIKGSEVGLKFAHLANKTFITANFERPGSYIEPDGSFTELGWAKLFHCAYLACCDIKEIKATLTVEDFYNWIETVGKDETAKNQFVQAAQEWGASEATKELVAKINAISPEPEKKKGKKK